MTAKQTDEARVQERRTLQMQLTTQIVAAYFGHNQVPRDQIPEVVRQVSKTLAELDVDGPLPIAEHREPAVPVKKSVSDDFIICLEDGKKLRTLKRYLKTQHDLTPEEYRKKWGLAHDYPMVAPAYRRLRSAFAKKIGLGRTAGPRKPKGK